MDSLMEVITALAIDALCCLITIVGLVVFEICATIWSVTRHKRVTPPGEWSQDEWDNH